VLSYEDSAEQQRTKIMSAKTLIQQMVEATIRESKMQGKATHDEEVSASKMAELLNKEADKALKPLWQMFREFAKADGGKDLGWKLNKREDEGEAYSVTFFDHHLTKALPRGGTAIHFNRAYSHKNEVEKPTYTTYNYAGNNSQDTEITPTSVMELMESISEAFIKSGYFYRRQAQA
jgi:hypothetical protein